MKRVIFKADYLGGMPTHPKARESVRLVFDDTGVSARAFKTFLEAPWHDVFEVAVEGQDSVERRITATRLLLTGPFALAFRKKKNVKVSYITVRTASDEAIFKIDGNEPHETKAQIAAFALRATGSPQEPPSDEASESEGAAVDVTAQLVQLAALRDSGALTEDEFTAAKARLL